MISALLYVDFELSNWAAADVLNFFAGFSWFCSNCVATFQLVKARKEKGKGAAEMTRV